jgi:hypothetical protein
MGLQYILNSELKTQEGANMDPQLPSGHASPKACKTTQPWAKLQALQATMGSLKGTAMKDQETFQSTGMPAYNHCNGSQAGPSR